MEKKDSMTAESRKSDIRAVPDHEVPEQNKSEIDRRSFLKRFALSAGLIAASGFVKKAEAIETGILSNTALSGSTAEPFAEALKEYVVSTYIKHDQHKGGIALGKLSRYSITEEDLTPLVNVNCKLIAKGFFLTYYYVDSLVGFPVIKLFRLVKRDIFDGFMVKGEKKTHYFGQKIDPYYRVLLGNELFSTYDAPPAALFYQLNINNLPEPSWVIAIPYGWVRKLYANHGKEIVHRMVESLTMHEIGHIVHNTPNELLPFLIQFGYMMDWNRQVTSVSDMISYLNASPQTFDPAARILLEKIFYADYYYGKSANFIHMDAMSEIKQKMLELCNEINKRDSRFSKKLMNISDQQAYASMEFLYHAACRKNTVQNSQIGSLNLST